MIVGRETTKDEGNTIEGSTVETNVDYAVQCVDAKGIEWERIHGSLKDAKINRRTCDERQHTNVRLVKRTVTTTFGPWEEVGEDDEG